MSFWDRLVESLRDVGESLGEWIPKIIGALIILIIGWIIARFLRRITKRLLAHPAVAGILDRAGIGPALKNSGYDAATLGANIVYFFLWIVVLLLTFQALGVPAIVALLERFLAWLPLAFIALIIVVIIVAVGNFVSDMVKPWADSQGITWLGWLIRAGFILFGLVTALEILGIGFFTNAITTALLGGLGIAFAIAFGVGGIDTARKWWDKYLSPRSE